MRRPLAVLVASALVALAGSACSSTLADAATVTYRAQGHSHTFHVRRDDLLRDVKALVGNQTFAKLLTQNGFSIKGTDSTDIRISSTWLTVLIKQGATDALFAERHLKVTPALRTRAEQDAPTLFGQDTSVFAGFSAAFKSAEIDRTARQEAVVSSYVQTSDRAARAYYAAHTSQFACASGRSVAHILVRTKAEAQQILDQLRGGASFANLAKQKSIDKGSGAQGGALGCLAPNEFVAPFESAAQSAPFDRPIGPVQSQFGFHVILVSHPGGFESVRSQVQQALVQQGRLDAQRAVDALLRSFKVHLDPRYGKWKATTDSQGQPTFAVMPPTAPTPNTSREGTTSTTAAPSVPGATGP